MASASSSTGVRAVVGRASAPGTIGAAAEVESGEHGGVIVGWTCGHDPDFAELSSLRAQLEELTTRVVRSATATATRDDSAVAGELDQAERALLGAVRSLDRATGMLRGLPIRGRAARTGSADGQMSTSTQRRAVRA